MSTRFAGRAALGVMPRCTPHACTRSFVRSFAAGTTPTPKPSKAPLYGAVGLGVAGLVGYFVWASSDDTLQQRYKSFKSPSKTLDYQAVYNDIAGILEDEKYDDGSYGPVLVRLAWHASGTYDKDSGNGGSNGATMRFVPESDHGANAGLRAARDRLEKIYQKYSKQGLTYSDLWTLAGVCAIQEMDGPKIPWRPGRQDGVAANCTPDGRLPDGDKDQHHLRKIFYRQGFNDQEIVALSGAHALGRCHLDRSGFEGPWTFSPITFTNDYFRLLFDEKWQPRKWKGPPQYEDKSTKSLMMLNTDMSLVMDKSFKQFAKKYAESQAAFFEDFSKAFAKLMENGVPSKNFENKPPRLFKTTAELEK